MDRTFTTVAVLAMMLGAITLCIKQTFDARGVVDDGTIWLLFAAEGTVAALVVAAAVTVLRRRFASQRKRVNRRQVGVAVRV